MLVLDAVLVLPDPLPDALDELLAPELVAICALFGQLLVDHGLGRDARVVLAGHPERRVAAHAMIANHDVFQRGGDGVAQMQRARHVGRRHGDDEGLLVGIALGRGLNSRPLPRS